MKYILLIALLFFIVDARLRTHKPIDIAEGSTITAVTCDSEGKNGVCFDFQVHSCQCATDSSKLNCGIGHDKCTGNTEMCCVVPNKIDERPTPIKRYDFSEGDTIAP